MYSIAQNFLVNYLRRRPREPSLALKAGEHPPRRSGRSGPIARPSAATLRALRRLTHEQGCGCQDRV